MSIRIIVRNSRAAVKLYDRVQKRKEHLSHLKWHEEEAERLRHMADDMEHALNSAIETGRFDENDVTQARQQIVDVRAAAMEHGNAGLVGHEDH